jgi:hypothetical protein
MSTQSELHFKFQSGAVVILGLWGIKSTLAVTTSARTGYPFS